ncbi:hypothetical protein SAMN05518672_106151 [Chitinophaga sp. CF118]|uniref:tetratricopeptide repeat protein n=1 Tax=Chitinophaga sp. CF118 TaxID=1884367 RepID=UPI0008EBF6A3|nr:hypothetical protein [Chitinophaga sp. CF118]SFE44614.1 hypothetical protein SAMN05518672_106151 [Chitinophaga sp. CF118]
MEDNLLLETEEQCIHCKTTQAIPGYPMNLCTDCRNTFNNYPIPKWLWIFAAVILLLMIAGLIRMPDYFDASVHLRRAEKAVEQHKYITAKKEADKVLKHLPGLLEANGYKFIAAAYTFDERNLNISYEQLQDKPINDKELLAEINKAMEYTEQLIPTDTLLLKSTDNFSNYATAIQENFLDSLNDGVRTTDKALFGYRIANNLFKKKDYKTCIAVLKKTLAISPDNYGATGLLIASKRNAGDYKGALASCDVLLAINREDARIIAQQCKIRLLQKQDKEAAMLAKQAITFGPDDISALEAQAMVYYFSGKKPESNKLLARIRAMEAAFEDSLVSERLSKILNGTDPYR